MGENGQLDHTPAATEEDEAELEEAVAVLADPSPCPPIDRPTLKGFTTRATSPKNRLSI
ncbi:MAG: hypothetical protein WCP28_15995 [Actinomycetes bacterium]